MQQALPAPPPSPRSLGLPPSRPRWAFPTNGDTGTRPFTGRCVLQARPPCVCPHFLFGTGRCAAAWTGHTGRAHSDAGGGEGGRRVSSPGLLGAVPLSPRALALLFGRLAPALSGTNCRAGAPVPGAAPLCVPASDARGFRGPTSAPTRFSCRFEHRRPVDARRPHRGPGWHFANVSDLSTCSRPLVGLTLGSPVLFRPFAHFPTGFSFGDGAADTLLDVVFECWLTR